MIYGVAGPEVAVGPRLGAEAELTVSPFAENYDELVNFTAEVGLTVNAVVGAKLEVLGYKLGEFTKTIELAGPWTLSGEKHAWFDKVSDNIHKMFIDDFGREPSRANSEDMKWLVNCTHNYDRIMADKMTPDRDLISRITNEQVIPMYGSKYPIISEGTWYEFTTLAYNTEWKETGKKPQTLSDRMKELIISYAKERIYSLENEAAQNKAQQQKADEDYQKMIQEMMRLHKPFFEQGEDAVPHHNDAVPPPDGTDTRWY